MEYIDKNKLSENLEPDSYIFPMLKELNNTPHKIISVNGSLRWEEDTSLGNIDLNQITSDFYESDIDKNNEIWRNLYRRLGYSLYGYWEVFYWDANNIISSDYNYTNSIKEYNNK